MPRFSEQVFDNWSKSASVTEELRISNAISMIKDAINSSYKLKDKDIEIFVQGSYANNTNVRANSDVDVCVMLKDTFYSKYPDGLKREDYGFSASNYDFSTYKKSVLTAIIDKFGEDNVKLGNKSIKIKSNSHHIDADAVPCFQYRNYRYKNSTNQDIFVEGTEFYAQNKQEIISYPKKHVENGRTKNANTQRRFKRTARILKKIRYHMINNNEPIDSSISSFLIECLLWNVPDNIFNENINHTDRVKEVIRYLYFQIKNHKQEC